MLEWCLLSAFEKTSLRYFRREVFGVRFNRWD